MATNYDNKEIEIADQESSEPLLNWLQEFYAIKIAPLKCKIGNAEIKPLLPEFISDEQIQEDYWSFKKVADTPGLLKINTISNPGWSLHFGYYNIPYVPQEFTDLSINTGENLVEADSNEWFCRIKNNTFYTASGPVYLTLCMEAFRSYIEQEPFNITTLEETREKFAPNNFLLRWLEYFFFSYCERLEDDFFRYYVPAGMSMISTAQGWVIAFPLDDLVGGGKPFERVFLYDNGGTVECYKIEEDLFIIRAHFRGLIKGLTIFKEWAEENLFKSSES